MHLVTPAPLDEPKTVAPAKEDPTRFEYHQRRADLAEAKLKQMEAYAELGRKVAENQELLAQVSGKTSAPPQQAPVVPVAIPKEPTRPANFSEEDAYNDPHSESFKYRVAKDRYRDELMEYVAKQEMNREAQRQAELKARQEQEMIQRNMAALKSQLVHQYGYSPSEADDFMVTLNDAPSIPHLVKLHKIIQQERNAGKGGAGAPPLNMGPTPPVVLGGGNGAPMSPDDNFNAGFAKYRKPVKQ